MSAGPIAVAVLAIIGCIRTESPQSWRHINNNKLTVDREQPPLLTFHDPITKQTLRPPIVTTLPAYCNHPNHPNGPHQPQHQHQHRYQPTAAAAAAAACNSWMPPVGGGADHSHAPPSLAPLTLAALRQSSGFGLPCSCAMLNCGCCVGVSGSRPRFERQYCTNLTYDPNAFSIGMNVLQDDNSVYEYSVSGRNPSPLCVPVPYMPLAVDLCVRLFNVFTPGRNLHVCMDWMARVLHQPVFVLHFDCMRMGADGVALVKPFQHGGLPQSTTVASRLTTTTTTTTTTTEQADSSVFDPVTEIK